MLTHASQPFTPTQLVESGRRAEAQGRPDLAIQFYRYLTEHFSQAEEAAEAYNALGRIGAAQSLPLIARARLPRRPGPAPGSGHGSAGYRPPARSDRYRTGRALTALLGVLGWLLAAAGTAAVPAYVLLLRVQDAGDLTRAELLPMAGGAAGSLVLGVGVVLAAQIARAHFDQANATHDLVALERARLGLD
jgi:hypothetical protein